MWKIWNPYTLLVAASNTADVMKKNAEIPTKSKIESPYDPAISLVDIFPNVLKLEC